MATSRKKLKHTPKFENRLYQASEEELVFRILSNPRFEGNVRVQFLMELSENPELLKAALMFAKNKIASYGTSRHEQEKSAKAEMVVEDLKSILCFGRLEELHNSGPEM